jgi:hypothetical protein
MLYRLWEKPFNSIVLNGPLTAGRTETAHFFPSMLKLSREFWACRITRRLGRTDPDKSAFGANRLSFRCDTNCGTHSKPDRRALRSELQL